MIISALTISNSVFALFFSGAYYQQKAYSKTAQDKPLRQLGIFIGFSTISYFLVGLPFAMKLYTSSVLIFCSIVEITKNKSWAKFMTTLSNWIMPNTRDGLVLLVIYELIKPLILMPIINIDLIVAPIILLLSFLSHFSLVPQYTKQSVLKFEHYSIPLVLIYLCSTPYFFPFIPIIALVGLPNSTYFVQAIRNLGTALALKLFRPSIFDYRSDAFLFDKLNYIAANFAIIQYKAPQYSQSLAQSLRSFYIRMTDQNEDSRRLTINPNNLAFVPQHPAPPDNQKTLNDHVNYCLAEDREAINEEVYEKLQAESKTTDLKTESQATDLKKEVANFDNFVDLIYFLTKQLFDSISGVAIADMRPEEKYYIYFCKRHPSPSYAAALQKYSFLRAEPVIDFYNTFSYTQSKVLLENDINALIHPSSNYAKQTTLQLLQGYGVTTPPELAECIKYQEIWEKRFPDADQNTIRKIDDAVLSFNTKKALTEQEKSTIESIYKDVITDLYEKEHSFILSFLLFHYGHIIPAKALETPTATDYLKEFCKNILKSIVLDPFIIAISLVKHSLTLSTGLVSSPAYVLNLAIIQPMYNCLSTTENNHNANRPVGCC